MLRVMLIGSNFLSSALFVRLCSFENVHVTVMDRRDPMTIMNYNQDTYNIIKRYCKDLQYRDLYNDQEFGDPKRNIKISFKFHDYINEPLTKFSGYDIVVYTGAVYDTIYADHNRKETLNVNINGLYNVLNNLESLTDSVRTKDRKPLFIHMSSINVYGDQTNRNEKEITEDSTVPNPKDLLNLSLYTQENMVKSLVNTDYIDYMILRLGTICGEFTPRDSLVTAAVSAMLLGKKEFTVYNGSNSIELLDINDLGMLMVYLISMYKDGKEEDYKKIVNQIYNIKVEETNEKTVMGVVKAIYSAASNLPSITKEHGIKGIDGFKIKVPKIVESFSQYPKIKFDKPVSSEKTKELLKFIPNKPMIYSLLPSTANYLLNYILVDFSEAERKAFAKILYLASTPHPDIDERIHKDVNEVIKEVNENIEKGFE